MIWARIILTTNFNFLFMKIIETIKFLNIILLSLQALCVLAVYAVVAAFAHEAHSSQFLHKHDHHHQKVEFKDKHGHHHYDYYVSFNWFSSSFWIYFKIKILFLSPLYGIDATKYNCNNKLMACPVAMRFITTLAILSFVALSDPSTFISPAKVFNSQCLFYIVIP